MSKKLDQVRVVTFKEDYAPGKSKRAIYKKGETHAIHFSIVEKLEANKAKIEVKEFEVKKETEKAKKEFEDAKKAEKQN